MDCRYLDIAGLCKVLEKRSWGSLKVLEFFVSNRVGTLGDGQVTLCKVIFHPCLCTHWYLYSLCSCFISIAVLRVANVKFVKCCLSPCLEVVDVRIIQKVEFGTVSKILVLIYL